MKASGNAVLRELGLLTLITSLKVLEWCELDCWDEVKVGLANARLPPVRSERCMSLYEENCASRLSRQGILYCTRRFGPSGWLEDWR